MGRLTHACPFTPPPAAKQYIKAPFQQKTFSMSVWTIILLCLAAAGLYYFFPKMPQLAQIIVAIVGCIVCLLVIANAVGVQTGLHF